ncbi:MAG: protein kinase domain-containing protein [Wenzhouxiangellaceae bacterium]
MERIGRYEIVRELGRGSMSIVYEAFDSRIDRHLAIKVLRRKFASDVNARQRFLREARAAGSLSHPNVVTVFDVGQAETSPYMVMELLRGQTLEQWLDQTKATDIEVGKLIDLVTQLARGLAHAHAHGVIHRDVKPANIHYDAGSNTAKMMDFGIAAIDTPHRPTSSNQPIAGTLTHLSPEVLAGDPPGQRSDLYSLGVVLYQLLTGTLPFDGESADEIIEQIIQHRVRPLEPSRPGLPVELTDLALRLMALEPDSRPSSAMQVVEELEEIREGLGRGLLQEARQRSAEWRWPVVTGLAVALVIVLGLQYVHYRQNQAMAEATYAFGDALASLVAQETAEALILEDTTALAVLVSDFAANPGIRHLHIANDAGIIQASTDPFLRGEMVTDSAGRRIAREDGSVELLQTAEQVLEFRVPVRYQARRVGQVRLGLDGQTLKETARATLVMLTAVFLTSLTALAIGLAWLTRRQQRVLRRLAWGLKRLQRGQFQFRLDASPRDEFAHAYREFNRLAVRLEESTRPAKATTTDAGEKSGASSLVFSGSPDETQELLEANQDPDDARDPDDPGTSNIRQLKRKP